ncbi:hypothetical protein ZWY2020_037951 [Hordeum vulgare]|nr:hypothetical protein ZWY2020_037951 [Hordeum vulgare]
MPRCASRGTAAAATSGRSSSPAVCRPVSVPSPSPALLSSSSAARRVDSRWRGLPSSNGHASPAVVEKSEDDGVIEVEGEASHNSEAGLGEQGTAAAGELGGQNAPTELRIDHAEAKDDSAPPAVESVLNAKDGESEKSAATEVVAPEEQQDGDNAPAESSGSDEPPRHAESVSVVLESEGSVEQSKGEEVVAEIMKDQLFRG